MTLECFAWGYVKVQSFVDTDLVDLTLVASFAILTGQRVLKF